MIAVYFVNISCNTDTSEAIADMVSDGFSPEVADWLARFIPSVPGMLVKRRFRLDVDEVAEPFTVDELKALLNGAAALDDARERVSLYRRMNGRAAVSIDHDRYYTIDDTGAVVELI